MGKGKFENVSKTVGPDFLRRIVARGAAYADFDRDGDLDILISTNGGPGLTTAQRWRQRNHWITLKLVGRNRTAARWERVAYVETRFG